MLRALLAMRLEYSRATSIAAAIGQGMAWMLGIVGLFYNPFMIVIALLIRVFFSQALQDLLRLRRNVGAVVVEEHAVAGGGGQVLLRARPETGGAARPAGSQRADGHRTALCRGLEAVCASRPEL